MKNLEPDQTICNVYFPLFRVHAHYLLFLGYSDARKKIRFDGKETDITGFITSAIKNRLRSPNPPKWYKHYFVADDPPIEGENRAGRDRLRLDIIIEANWEGRPEYCFEAKRLRKNDYPVSKYVGSDGMGCFLSGRYASRYQEVAMIGYVQSETLGHWRGKIFSEIDRLAISLFLKSLPRDEIVIDELPIEWVSQHDRENISSPITIYHILLDCC